MPIQDFLNDYIVAFVLDILLVLLSLVLLRVPYTNEKNTMWPVLLSFMGKKKSNNEPITSNNKWKFNLKLQLLYELK